MQHISLFSGIGGFELAAEWMGWQNIASCEINEFGNKVLNYYWPDAYHHDDIHTFTYEKLNYEMQQRHGMVWRTNDIILTGGFPCQPYSAAGKRLGKEDDRHLWPEMLRIIREVKPTWIVGENVYGLVNWNDGLVFEEVQADLEAEGYEVQPFILPAASVNAPHRRDRVWFVAHSNGSNDRRTPRQDEGEGGKERVQEWNAVRQSVEPSKIQRTASNSKSKSRRWKYKQRSEQGEFGGYNCSTDATNTSQQGLQGSQEQRSIGGSRKESHEQLTRFIQPNWNNFPTESPLHRRDDGLPKKLDGITFPKLRNESIKAYGNAVVPQVVYQIFQAIEQYRQTV